jgi:hypothetical protein
MDKRLQKGFSPQIAFVFASARQGIYEISHALEPYDIHIAGSSSGGNILANSKENIIFEDSIVITLIDLKEDAYDYLIVRQDELSDKAFGNSIGEWSKEKFSDPHLILLCSGMGLNGNELVEGILEITGDDITMFGGMAGDDIRFERNFVFNGKEVIDKGAIVLAFDSRKIKMHGLTTSGWVGLGKDLTITESDGNIVYSIDYESALEVYKKYLSVQDSDLPAIGVEYPLMIKQEDNSYSLRAVMMVDKENHALIFSGTVPQDATVSFSSSPGFEVIERTKEKIRQYHTLFPEADLLLLFSCMARHLALGPVITEEIGYSRDMWGLPVTGFFTYGEIATEPQKRSDFYNQSYSLVILTEM